MNKKKSILTSLILIVLLLVVAGVAYSMRPVCSLIADEALEHFGIPIEQREDRDFYLKVFQRKEDGHWYECKTLITHSVFSKK